MAKASLDKSFDPIALPPQINAAAERLSIDLRWQDNGDGHWDIEQETTTASGKKTSNPAVADITRIVHEANDVILYQVFTDRFQNGNSENDHSDRVDADLTRKSFSLYHGGDLQGIEQNFEYFERLGVTTIWVSPIFNNADGVNNTQKEQISAYHGYWPEDFYRMDEHITASGTAESIANFQSFVDHAHQHGIRVYTDMNVHHGPSMSTPGACTLYRDGVRLTSYQDDRALASGEWGAIYDDGKRHEFFRDGAATENYRQNTTQRLLHNPEISGQDWNDPYPGELYYGRLFDLCSINLENPEMSAMMFDVGARMASMVDGFRIDVSKHMTPIFLGNFLDAAREANPSLEVVHEWFNAGHNYDDGAFEIAQNPQAGVFDFNLHYVLANAFAKPEALYMDYCDNRAKDGRMHLLISVANYINKMKSSEANWEFAQNAYIFLNNHDLPRFLNYDVYGMAQAGTRETWKASLDQYPSMQPSHEAQDQAYLLLFCLPGKPTIYYGDEKYLKGPNNTDSFWGYGGDPANRGDFGEIPELNSPGVQWIQKLTALKHANPALTSGDIQVNVATDDTLAFTRRFSMGAPSETDNQVLYWHRRGWDYQQQQILEVPNWPVGQYSDPVSGKQYSITDVVQQDGSTKRILTIPADTTLRGGYRTVILALNSLTAS